MVLLHPQPYASFYVSNKEQLNHYITVIIKSNCLNHSTVSDHKALTDVQKYYIAYSWKDWIIVFSLEYGNKLSSFCFRITFHFINDVPTYLSVLWIP